MMLVGVVALNVLRVLANNDPRGIGVLLVGYFFQGIGSFITCVVEVFHHDMISIQCSLVPGSSIFASMSFES